MGFLKASDDRKEKQSRISIDAKLDSQDKSEVDSRKSFFLTKLFNKFLRIKMENEVKDSKVLEKIYLEVKKISVNNTLKNRLDKI